MSTDARAVVEAYWDAVTARDWERFGRLLADDVVYEMPQTRERIRGKQTYVRFNAEYPGDWKLSVVRLVAEPRHAVSWVDLVFDDGSRPPETGVSFFDLDSAGRIASIVDGWPEPYEPPAGREHLVERY